jgi:hypothetical protein
MTIIFTRNPFLKSLKPSACLVLLCLFFTTNFSFAQDKNQSESMPPPNGQDLSQKKFSGDLKKELLEIENSSSSPEEKESQKKTLLKAAGIKMESSSFDLDFTFRPNYLPASQLEVWKNLALPLNPNALKNVVFLNPAVFVDYNNYGDPSYSKKMAELAFLNPVEEKLALLYIIPDLNLLSSMLQQGASLVPNLRLYFSSQPDLLNLLPLELAALIKSDNGVQTLKKMQESAKKKNSN